jgi:type I restriction enzyme S subunit
LSHVGGGWPTVKLGDICEFRYGKALPADARNGGDVGVYGSNGVVGKHDRSLSDGPTIVIGRKGSYGEINYSVGRCWPIDTAYFIDSTATMQDLRWLSYRLAAMGLNAMNKSAAVPGLNREDAYRLELKLPPLPEQRRIAAILDQADALRAKRREALAQLDSLTQSIFIEMFGDPVENSRCWPIVKLGEHTSKMGSGATPAGGDAAYKASGISLIRSLNVRDGEFTYRDLAYIDDVQAAKLSNVVVSADDVLLNITGASVARVCRVPKEVLPARVNQHVMIIRPKSTIDGVFLERMLLSPNMKRHLLQIGGSGATREAITKAQAAELTVICPPLHLQQTFATRIQAVESLKSTHRAALAELDALFASLQHRAFNGSL